MTIRLSYSTLYVNIWYVLKEQSDAYPLPIIELIMPMSLSHDEQVTVIIDEIINNENLR